MVSKKFFEFEYIENGKLMRVITKDTGEFLKRLLLKYGEKIPEDFVVFPDEIYRPKKEQKGKSKQDITHLLDIPQFKRMFDKSELKGKAYWKTSLGKYEDFVNRLQRK